MADIFLKIEGVDGESMDKAHPNWIEIESWSFGVSQGASALKPRAEKPSFQDVAVVKTIDKATPVLFLKCCNGEHFPEATLSMRRAAAEPGGTQEDYFVIKMTDCLVSSFGPSATEGDPQPTEQVSFNFAKVEFSYAEQSAGGTGGVVKAGWDLKKNEKI
jgi:type VI secretion system secreted protein Hcp